MPPWSDFRAALSIPSCTIQEFPIMMVLLNLLFAVVISTGIAALFSLTLRRRNQWLGTAWFFLLMFLGTWAFGVWLRPVGPSLWSVQWVPFVVAAALLAILITTLTSLPPGTPPKGERLRVSEASIIAGRDEGLPPAPMSPTPIVWLLCGLALLALAIHYLRLP
jgi:ABC-type transport system involved in multi-copper enzyme maturation permease subunit